MDHAYRDKVVDCLYCRFRCARFIFLYCTNLKIIKTVLSITVLLPWQKVTLPYSCLQYVNELFLAQIVENNRVGGAEQALCQRANPPMIERCRYSLSVSNCHPNGL
jgi:hypothetical protein